MQQKKLEEWKIPIFFSSNEFIFHNYQKNRYIPKNNGKKTSKIFLSLKNIKYKLKKYLN